MNLQEMLQKTEEEILKLEDKEKKILERKKQLLSKKSDLEKQITAEKNKLIAEVVEKNIGTISKEKIEILSQLLFDSAEKFLDGESEAGENLSDPEGSQEE